MNNSKIITIIATLCFVLILINIVALIFSGQENLILQVIADLLEVITLEICWIFSGVGASTVAGFWKLDGRESEYHTYPITATTTITTKIPFNN